MQKKIEFEHIILYFTHIRSAVVCFPVVFWVLTFVKHCVILKYSVFLLMGKADKQLKQAWDRLQAIGKTFSLAVFFQCFFLPYLLFFHTLASLFFFFFSTQTWHKRIMKHEMKGKETTDLTCAKKTLCTTKQNKKDKA